MARQIIANSPADSGLGDSLYVAMNKINSNFAEVYSGLSATTITKTSELENDGADGSHPFISVGDAIPMSAVTSLNSSLQAINNSLAAISATTSGNTASISAIEDELVVINSTISTLTGLINTQNGQIATMQGDIADLYNIINNL
jgi:peptidoglycan hydrolase CwlO-like protein